MRIGLKYCGGCNPRYDRKDFAAKLCNDLGLACCPVGDRKEWELVLVLCGCTNCCADHSLYKGEKGKFIVKALEDYPEVRDRIREVLKQ